MKPTFFVQDKGRLFIRFAQVAGLMMIAYLLPFFGDIINVNILFILFKNQFVEW